MSCLGCELANNNTDVHIVYEDERITCILDIAPLSNGHTLILPKKHFNELDEIDKRTLLAIIEASKHISKALKRIYQPSGISVMQNGGSFNDLGHYHMHLFPRYIGDGFRWIEPTNVSVTSLEIVRQLIIDNMNGLSTIN